MVVGGMEIDVHEGEEARHFELHVNDGTKRFLQIVCDLAVFERPLSFGVWLLPTDCS